ncbi:AraC family transcriptional regulator [Lentilactobacillus sunkii]|nr:helix-turn-helix domain-containing protein [Lentilactobacillus sunkii]
MQTYTETEQPHYRDEVEFLLIRKGNGQIDINNTLMKISEGDLIQLMPYHVHHFVLNELQQLNIIRVRCSIGLLLMTSTNRKMYLNAVKRLDKQLPIIHLTEKDQKKLETFCNEIISERKVSHNADPEPLNIALIAILSYVIEKNKNQKESIQLNIGWQCLQYVQVHHQESDLDQLKVAQALRIQKNRVDQLIKGLTGNGFHKILNQVRIRNATALLQFDELSINQIAQICGYQTQSNFYKQFKLVHDVYPSVYRETLLGKASENISLDAWSIVMVILQNCTKPFSLTDLVEATHFSKKSIELLLQRNLKTTFKQLRDEFRVQIAHSLLKSLDLSVGKVAYHVGFSDINTFTRNFKKVYGVTPSKMLHA